ncbi:MAG: hypothetical protein NWE97_01150 [Candidatus Bathyarchaeota archaeon]|nr:hypothetical protein [Candidatus Bathyarchaeota archaeon]
MKSLRNICGAREGAAIGIDFSTKTEAEEVANDNGLETGARG